MKGQDMKIVEAKPFAHEFACKGCGSQLIAEAEDVRKGDFSSCLSDGHNYQYYVVCPVCNSDNIIDRKLVTPKVAEMAESKYR